MKGGNNPIIVLSMRKAYRLGYTFYMEFLCTQDFKEFVSLFSLLLKQTSDLEVIKILTPPAWQHSL